MIEERMQKLKEKIIDFSLLAEEMVRKSMQGLIERKKEYLSEVIDTLENKANMAEVEIDGFCVETIARFQPVAKDLRTIVMILKMNNDLERVGDTAVNISESALFLIERPFVKKLIDLPKMSEIVSNMLKESVLSFINGDTKLAREICKRDDIVDALNEQIIRELLTYMLQDSSTIERSLHLIRISRSLERIADMSTNFCEDVIFIEEGKIIKHHFEE